MSDITASELASLTMATLLGYSLLTSLDRDIGLVGMILIPVIPILCVGLLCEHFRSRNELGEPLKKEVASEPDELLEDEMLIHFDDYDDEDLEEDEEQNP